MNVDIHRMTIVFNMITGEKKRRESGPYVNEVVLMQAADVDVAWQHRPTLFFFRVVVNCWF